MADPNIATKKRREPRWPADTYAALTVKGLEGGNQAFGAVLDVCVKQFLVLLADPVPFYLANGDHLEPSQ